MKSLRPFLTLCAFVLVAPAFGQSSATAPSDPAPASATASGAGTSGVPQAVAQRIFDQATPSLVAVQFTWEYEFGKAEFVLPGVVVSDDGLIMLPYG